jgi:hypothetical protein
MTREEIIAVIEKTAEELGHVPSLREVLETEKVTRYEIRMEFGGYKAALEACGMERQGPGYEVKLAPLFQDWAGLVRRMGKVPSILEYERHGKHCHRPLIRHFGGWAHVPAGMARFAQEQGHEEEWKDVLDVVAKHVPSGSGYAKSSWRAPGAPLKLLAGEPIYGPPTVDADLMLAPTNEQGVIFLFGAVARKLGFVVLRIQTEYPDCEALREMEPDRWQRIPIEFEYESRNFLMHGHAAEKCRLIVCWRHNWEECPMEVLELRSAVKNLIKD